MDGTEALESIRLLDSVLDCSGMSSSLTLEANLREMTCVSWSVCSNDWKSSFSIILFSDVFYFMNSRASFSGLILMQN